MQQLRQKPIPNLDLMREMRKGVRAYPLDLNSIENTEYAVELSTRDVAGENYYFRQDNPPYYHRAPGSIKELYVRTGIIWRIDQVNKELKRIGLELYVFDAYRPIEVQNYFHDRWVPQYLQNKNSGWSMEKIESEVGNYWAKGTCDGEEVDPLSPPPHMTGGVIDCTVRIRHSGEHLYMGTQFDEVDRSAHTDYFEKEKLNRSLSISEETALYNRRLLYWIMNSVGMINNPNEWWHYSYGDQLWAKLSGSAAARYSIMSIGKR